VSRATCRCTAICTVFFGLTLTSSFEFSFESTIVDLRTTVTPSQLTNPMPCYHLQATPRFTPPSLLNNSYLALHEEPAPPLPCHQNCLGGRLGWSVRVTGTRYHTCQSDGELVTYLVKSWPYMYSYGILSNVQGIMFGSVPLIVRSCHTDKVL